jgi:DNA-binding response OmpR family regulator
MESATTAVESNQPDTSRANDVADARDASEEHGPTSSEKRPQPRASSLASSLQRALAAREALLHELDQQAQRAVSDPTAPFLLERDEVTAATQCSERERAELAHRLQQSESEVEELRQLLAERDSRICSLESQLSEAQAACSQSLQEVDAARMAALEEQYAELVAATERERQQHSEEIASLTQQNSQLRSRYESQIAELTSRRDGSAERPGDRERLQPGSNGNQAAREVAHAPAEEPPAAQDRDEPPTPALLIVDDSEIGQGTERRLAKFGFPTLALRADNDLGAQLRKHQIVCMALNLGLPSTWRVLRKLRTSDATAETPIIAYILMPRTETGYWLGQVDFVTLPLAYNDLLASLQQLARPVRHVILIGMNDRLATRVRDQLASANVSVTTAQDRRGALDAVRGKYPQAAVVYAAHNPVDGFRAIAGIRGLAIFKDLPTVFLLDPTAVDREDERLSAGARTLLRLGALKPHALVDLVASAMSTFKSPNGSAN